MARSNDIIRRGFISSLLLLAFATTLASQVLRGKVIQKDTRAPLPSVNVYLKDTKYGMTTDSLGDFRIEKFPLGVYVVEARRVGYKPNRYILTAEREEPIDLDIELEIEPVQMEGIDVSGSLEKSKQLSAIGKTFITSEEITRAGTKSLSTFLKSKYPGLFPSYKRRTYERLHFTLYLNGALVQYTSDVLDSMIDVDQIDYIEVYRDFGSTPTKDRGSNERVIHIHTKIPDLHK